MTEIAKAFEHGKAFISFIVGGDPSLEVTEKLLPAMAQAGADLIEIGLPFSDPVAEGTVIQAGSERALQAGCTADKLFDTLERTVPQLHVPVVLLTYLNPVLTYGKDKFMSRCKNCGISGLIVPDMPFEEKSELKSECDRYGIEIISMIAPTSQERISMIAKDAQGFIYCVSSMGVTGVRDKITSDIGCMVNAAKSAAKIPVAVGFGISSPEQAAEISSIADGVIVGSAIVKIVGQYGQNCIDPVCEYIRQMKAAVSKSGLKPL